MKTRRIISILLSVCMLLSIAGIAASAATATGSVAAADLTVAATSNLGASTTQTVDSTGKVTVTYYVNVADTKMLNIQWTLTYDQAYLQFDETDGVNLNYVDGDVDSYNMMPAVGTADTSAVYNYDRTNEILGNTSKLAKFNLSDNGSKVALVSVTFNALQAGSTTVNLDVEVAQIVKGTATDETNLFFDSEIVDTTVNLNAEAAVASDGEEEAILDKTKCKFKSVSVSFDNSLALNYYVESSIYNALEDPYVIFTRAGSDVETKVTEATYNSSLGRYAFTFTGIYPQLVGDTVTGVLYGKVDGVLYCSKNQEYSVKQYAEALYPTANNNMKTLLVDLLNFGAATQTVQGYKTNALVNAGLTADQQAMGTQTNPTLTSIAGNAVKIDNKTLNWRQAAAVFDNSVSVKFTFDTTTPIEDVTIKFSIGNRGVVGVYTAEDFTYDSSTGRYTVAFDKAFANEFSDKILVTAYDGAGNAISNTYRYSIESYIQSNISSVNTNTRNMFYALMKYGNSVVTASGHTKVTA